MKTIRINNIDIDKYEVYEYLYILIFAYENPIQDENIFTEIYNSDTYEFVKACIGSENIDEFIKYTSKFNY